MSWSSARSSCFLRSAFSPSSVSTRRAAARRASALAHELNQPLTAITGYLKGCGMILDRMDGEHIAMLQHGIQGAAEEALRASEAKFRIVNQASQFLSAQAEQLKS